MLLLSEVVSLATRICTSHNFYDSYSERLKFTMWPPLKTLQLKFLFPVLIARASFWLHGPYVYALYETYGLQKAEIAVLFTSFFLSAGLLGIPLGSAADRYGRKKLVEASCVMLMVGSFTTIFKNYYLLLFGRILTGASFSLLSSFEAWFVNEASKRSCPTSYYFKVYSLIHVLDCVQAILLGILARRVSLGYGFVSPFMCALLFSFIVLLLVHFTWHETAAETTKARGSNILVAARILHKDRRILSLSLQQVFFETAVQAFIFLWTPALMSTFGESVRLDVVFAGLMVSSSLGSFLFARVVQPSSALESFPSKVIMVATVCLLLPFLEEGVLSLLAFFIFQFCCGMYYPCMASLRSQYLPELSRCSIMSIALCFQQIMIYFLITKVMPLTTTQAFIVSSLLAGTAVVFSSKRSTEKVLVN